MRIVSFLAFILLSICATVYANVDVNVGLYDFGDDTHAYVQTIKMDSMPSEGDQKGYTQAAYEQMKVKAGDDGRVVPGTMSASYWPDAQGKGGTLILHSSIKGPGGQTNEFTTEFINNCNMGGHRYRGMCAEIGTIAWAKTLQDEGKLNSNHQVRWAVYGVIDEAGNEGFMAPCGDQGGRKGCSTYVAEVAKAANGGGRCLTKREPEPAGPLRPLRPEPDTPNAPITPGSPTRPDGQKSPDTPETPTRLGQDPKKPKDDPDAQTNKDKDGFEAGGFCALPSRSGAQKVVSKRDIRGTGLFRLY